MTNFSIKLNLLINTIKHYTSNNIIDFAFYDDALLYHFEDNFSNVLNYIIKHNIECRLHAPNAVHAKYIKPNAANMMYESGFKTIRIGFETTDIKRQKEIGNKANTKNIIEAVENLKNAGFKKRDIGVYIMIGLKEQNIEEIRDTVDFISTLSVMVKPVTYTPIPHTQEFYKYLKDYPELETEPLYQNDTFFIVYSNFMSNDELTDLKNYIRKLNSKDINM